MSGSLCGTERHTGVFTCEVCLCVYARMHVELIFCSVHTYVCWEGRGARTVQSLKKISPTLVYLEIYSSCGDGGASFVFHTKLVIIV